MHIAVTTIIALIVLHIVAIVGKAATGFCPPAGPWPLPQRCSNPVQAPPLKLKSMFRLANSG